MELIHALSGSGVDVTHVGHSRVFREGLGMRHVYIGWCGGGVTKWVTAKPWNGTLHEVDGVPCDAQGREVLVFREGDEGFEAW